MKWLVVLALVSAIFLVGCSDDQPSFLIVQGAGISNVTETASGNLTVNPCLFFVNSTYSLCLET